MVSPLVGSGGVCVWWDFGLRRSVLCSCVWRDSGSSCRDGVYKFNLVYSENYINIVLSVLLYFVLLFNTRRLIPVNFNG
jgi:hypothetical protein